jgi:hypothetical protein
MYERVKTITGAKFHLIVLRPPGRDINNYATSKDRVTDDYIHRSVEGILLFANCSSQLKYTQYRVQHVVINMDKINMINNYREYPKIGNCPTLPACVILHMDRRKKGSFLFLGFTCIRKHVN